MSDQVTITHPIQVKVIMTDQFRNQLRGEVQASMAQVQDNLERLNQIQGEAADAPWVAAEKARLTRMKSELEWRMKEAEQVKDGAEIPLTTYQGTATVKVGDNLRQVLNCELVLKDWTVVAIRHNP
ncbi:hypothetical protein DYH09_04445 [bacterium CPR1]|nr:hypothetical protein [bacterium CPR1]